VCVHHGRRGADGLGHGERFADDVLDACEQAGLDTVRRLPAEGRDLNDLHREGSLGRWLDEVLEGDAWAAT
jgi:hypothetical protein